MKIITKIIGGIGNQMFQYAIGRAMAIKNNATLILDTYDYKTYRRPYYLYNFQIAENYLSDNDALCFRKYEYKYSPSLIWQNIKTIQRRKYRLEKPSERLKFIPEFLETANNDYVYLNGYWQNEKYFKQIRKVLCEDFNLKEKHKIDETNIFLRAKKLESIAIHFRRGEDQVNKPLYGVPPLEYYHNALKMINTKFQGNTHAIIFTNEPEWVKSNFKPQTSHEFAHDACLSDFQELFLMANCKHHIIANSTYSWWGAWLSDQNSGITIAPKIWFANNKYDAEGLYINNWIRM